jgi:hypothetical protein
MGSKNRKQAWNQLAGMYQGLLFLGGHIVDPDVAAGEDCDARARDAAAEAAAHRHAQAQVRLDARRLRTGAALSLFRCRWAAGGADRGPETTTPGKGRASGGACRRGQCRAVGQPSAASAALNVGDGRIAGPALAKSGW